MSQRQGAGNAGAEVEAGCRIAGLVKSYRTGFWGRRRPAVAGISFTVARATVTGLLGHNGAGKTTTLKAILDLVRPDAGRIEILGRDHHDRRARARVGYLPESPYFHDYLSAAELLDYYGRLCDMPARERPRRALEVLGLVGMAQHARTPLRKFSKGMLQRVGLAQALLHDPDLLVLDEPMSGLDPLGRREVRDLLGELRQRGKTILLSSHIVPDIEALADEVVMLQEGRIAGVHDLRVGAAPTFEVRLDGLPSDRRVADLLAGAPRRAPSGRRDGVCVQVADLPRLRVLLALCADEGIEVLAVQSRHGGLEDAFLRALGVARDPAVGLMSRRAPDATSEASRTAEIVRLEAELSGAGEGGRR